MVDDRRSDGAIRWSGIPDTLHKPHCRKVDGRWIIEVGSLGYVPIVFGCGPDNRGSIRDLVDWPGWRRTETSGS